MNHTPIIVAPVNRSLANSKKEQFNLNTYKVTLKRPVGAKLEALARKRREKIPILTVEQLRAAPDGVYLYILTDRGLLFNRVRSHLELGTAHRFLAQESGSLHVFVAGELTKTGSEIAFNLMSGTYTLEILNLYATDGEREVIEGRMRQHVQSLLEANGFAARFTTETFITEAAMPITRDELRNYANFGYNVRAYNRNTFCGPLGMAKLKKQIEQRERALAMGSDNPEDDEQLRGLKAKLAAAHECLENPRRFLGGRRTLRRRPHKR